MDDLPILVAVRVQGLVTAERAAVASGMGLDDATKRLEAMRAADLVKHRSGRSAGYTLTDGGKTELAAGLEREGLRGDEGLTESYGRFLRSNRRVIELSSSWQVRDDVPNDHTDLDYDESVISALVEVHEAAVVGVRKLTDSAARFGPYATRLDRCVDRLLDGDHAAFTAPMAESYHTVWFELHQDLMLTLGVEREG